MRFNINNFRLPSNFGITHNSTKKNHLPSCPMYTNTDSESSCQSNSIENTLYAEPCTTSNIDDSNNASIEEIIKVSTKITEIPCEDILINPINDNCDSSVYNYSNQPESQSNNQHSSGCKRNNINYGPYMRH